MQPLSGCAVQLKRQEEDSMDKRLIKVLCMLMSMILLVMTLPGCSSQDEAESTEDVAAAEDQAADGQQIGTDPNTGQPIQSVDISALGGNGADVDISRLSSTMVYSVVYDMVTHPDDYLGKKIRMSGTMSVYHDEASGNTYYACLISDATACCSEGIEFQTADGIDPSEYPSDGEPVTVLGTYEMFEDGGFQYGILKNAVLE